MLAQKHAVVRDENHGASEILQCIHQHFVARSRRLVGSSNQKIRWIVEKRPAIARRDFSPPDKARIFLSYSVAGELERACQRTQRADAVLREIALELLEIIILDSKHPKIAVNILMLRLAPNRTLPESGLLTPAIIFSSVVFPAPFFPITAQRSPRMVRLKTS